MSVGPADTIHHLLNERVVWLQEAGGSKWMAHHHGQKLSLTMNDFPEEPLYTLVLGSESLDLDDPPAGWVIPL